jgi:hypothetical protein
VGGAWVVVVQWTANTQPGFVQNMIRARSGEWRSGLGIRVRIGTGGRQDKGRLPPVVSSLFSIKAAHWRDGIRGTELGARGKERTARQRRVIRVKGFASRGGA